MLRTALAATAAALLACPTLAGAYVIDGPSSTGWLAIPYLTSPDFDDDQLTGADEADILGNASQPALQYGFDNAGTPSTTDGSLAFRLRLGADENPAGFKHVALVGLDVDLNQSVDILLVVDNKGGTPEVAIRRVSGAGTSPSTTGINTSSGVSYAQTASNYSWLSVSVLDPGPADLDADGEDDFYLSFAVSFADLVNQVGLLALPGFGGLDDTSLVAFVAGTSTNSNSVNQDWSGPDDSGWSQPWAVLGALSNVLIVPEPGSGALLSLGLVMLAVARRRA